MPAALPGLQVNGDKAVAEQIGSGALAAEKVRRWRFHREIGEAKVFIDGHLRPHTGVAVHIGRIVQPGLIAELAFLRHGVEGPHALAGAHVEGAHIALGVVVGLGREAFAEGGGPCREGLLRPDLPDTDVAEGVLRKIRHPGLDPGSQQVNGDHGSSGLARMAR